jgi:hypothetical protein
MLEDVWEQFYICITQYDRIIYFTPKLICGVNFLYVQPKNTMNEESIKSLFITCSKQFTEKYTLIYRIEYIRTENNNFVFRHRFYVPNKKMFCCGNKCSDCTRFRK